MMAQPYESRRENLLRSYHVQFPLKPKDRIHLEAVGEIMRPTGCSFQRNKMISSIKLFDEICL